MTFFTKPTQCTYFLLSCLLVFGFTNTALAQRKTLKQQPTSKSVAKQDSMRLVKDTVVSKTGKGPVYRPKDRFTNRFIHRSLQSPFVLKDPKTIKDDFRFNPKTQEISISEKLSSDKKSPTLDYRPVQSLTLPEYNELQNTRVRQSILRDYENQNDGNSATQGKWLKPLLEKGTGLDRIFGGNVISAKPNGFITLDFKYLHQFRDVPNGNAYTRTTNTFDFQQHINTNLNTKIGDKMGFLFNFDTKAAFNFDNKLKLNFKNQPEDILQTLEAGNVSFPIPSQLIPGVQNLFGVKAKMRFGKLDVTAVASQQRSRTESIRLSGGSQSRNFEVRADAYDENRHFFLSQFFRNNYEKALRKLPLILTDVRITRVEAYVTNKTASPESMRNLVAFSDLGDSDPYNPILRKNPRTTDDLTQLNLSPVSNKANPLFEQFNNNSQFRSVNSTRSALVSFQSGDDYEILRGSKRLVPDRDFKFNPQLGYISLTTALRNDEVLAVAYEYTYKGQTYKVGELSEDYATRGENDVIIMKLLKSTNVRNHAQINNNQLSSSYPMWNLMMKNVYPLGATQINKTGFQMRIIYKDSQTGINNPSLQEGAYTAGVPLIKLMGLDRLNSQNDPPSDGNFDFVEDVTIDTKLGKIFFPVLEPFGEHLNKQFAPFELELKTKYTYQELYQGTLSDAQQITSKDKFYLSGSLQSANGAEVQLPLGVSPQSVKVFAGGQELRQGSDFSVDQLGKVRITNQSILNSAREIRVDYERNDLFNTQIRTMLGTRLDYNFSRDIHFGATMMSLRETPAGSLTRVAVGNEPVDNFIFGTDVKYRKDSRWLTRMLDGIPGIQTKENSAIQFSGEYARLIPGVSSRVGGNSMIDDFEAAKNVYSLVDQRQIKWRIGSTPKTADNRFYPENDNSYAYNYRRAKISAYNVDFTKTVTSSFGVDPPAGIDNSNPFERQFTPQDLFPGKSVPVAGLQYPQTILDISYFPRERGMYNYNPNLDSKGLLQNPTKNFGAIVRGLGSDTDFDNSNIEYVEFYLLDPFSGKVNDGIENKITSGGKLLVQIGDFSEDLVPNGRNDFENGLQAGSITTPNDPTPWGQSPHGQFLSDAFDSQAGSRAKQDVGLDGMGNADEKIFPNIKNGFLDQLKVTDPVALQAIQNDPSADDYQDFYTLTTGSVIQRYKNFLGMENNTPNPNELNLSPTSQLPPPLSTANPDKEDVNADNTINDTEAYYEYEINLQASGKKLNEPLAKFITDKVVTSDGFTWYQFRVPIKQFTNKFPADLTGFKSMRFMRLVLTDFATPVVLRMANFQLVGGQYRVYQNKIIQGALIETPEPSNNSNFTVGTVSVETNGCDQNGHCNIKAGEIPYVVPPGFVRDRDFTQQSLVQFNEQSVSMTVTDLKPNESKGAFKNAKFDLVNYKRLKMFVHLQTPTPDGDATKIDGQVGAFIRLGNDLENNYYEIEIPSLKVTPNGATAISDIWQDANRLEIPFKDLVNIKGLRDRSNASMMQGFTVKDTVRSEDVANLMLTYKVTVIGKPDLSSIQTMMIGVRNPGNANKTFTIWVDELRASGFEQTSGYAAIGTANIKLADIGTVSISGNIKTFGFGGVQDRISDRAREETKGFGIVSTLYLDKLLPEKWGLKIPFFINYDRQVITPHYNPLDPDMPLENALNNIREKYRLLGKTQDGIDKANEFQQLVIDQSTRRGFNFSNVRKIRTQLDKKQHFWDIENFSFTYAQNNISKSNIFLQEYTQNQNRGGITYQFSPKPLVWEPFKNNKSLEKPLFYWLKDFNLNLRPSMVAFRTDFDRSYLKTQLRISDGMGGLTTDGISPTFEKYFKMNRYYDVQWNLTKSINFSYNAVMNALIDEPYGALDTKAKRDSLWNNFWNKERFGRAKNFDQRMTFLYRLPLDKFFLLDWIQADYKQNAGYKFTASSFDMRDDNNILFGNVISNSRERGLQGKIDLVKLYNKFKYLRFANSPTPQQKRQTRNPGDDENIEIQPGNLMKAFTRVLMTVRGINFNYNILETTTLPGFLPSAGILGMDGAQNMAPGFDFITGGQAVGSFDKNNNNNIIAGDAGILSKALKYNWLTKSTEQNQLFMQSVTKRFEYSINLEPFKDFRLQIRGQLNRGDSYSANFVYDQASNSYLLETPVRSGNYSMSFWALKTAFSPGPAKNGTYDYGLFNNMLAYRKVFLDELNAQNASQVKGENVSQYVGGRYSLNSQDVLIPAFFTAYSGKKHQDGIPWPHWRIDYSGLASLEPFKRIFSSITLTHSYTATYSVGAFTSSLEYGNNQSLGSKAVNLMLLNPEHAFFGFNSSNLGTAFLLNDRAEFIPILNMSTIRIEEKFSPLIGIQVVTKGNITAKIEINKDRNVALELTSLRVAEIMNNQLMTSIGFKKKGVKLPFRAGNGSLITLKNDLNFQFQLAINDTRTIYRILYDGSGSTGILGNNIITTSSPPQSEAKPIQGNYNFQLKPSIQYEINKKVSMSFYVERLVNSPFVTSNYAYLISSTTGGLQVKINLAEL